jgi:hypothetical protein
LYIFSILSFPESRAENELHGNFIQIDTDQQMIARKNVACNYYERPINRKNPYAEYG